MQCIPPSMFQYAILFQNITSRYIFWCSKHRMSYASMPYQWPRYDHSNDCWTARDPGRRLCCPYVPAGKASRTIYVLLSSHKYKKHVNKYPQIIQIFYLEIILSICPQILSPQAKLPIYVLLPSLCLRLWIKYKYPDKIYSDRCTNIWVYKVFLNICTYT